MSLRTLKNVDVSGKRILMRADFNVPLKNGEITDDTRIQAALESITYLLERGASLVLMSHLGRPKGERKAEYSLAPVARRLSELLGRPVVMAEDVVGEAVEKQAQELKAGEVMLLENVRFYKEETENDAGFAARLASLGELFVNDAFGTAHRAHASTEGVTRHMPSCAGFLIEKEVSFFQPILDSPKKPMIAVIGGAKVSSKIAVLESLLKNASGFVIGGGMAYTFLRAQGYAVGKSLVEEDFIETASAFLKAAKEHGTTIVLPVDHVVASEFSADSPAEALDGIEIPPEKMGMDIGPRTIAAAEQLIRSAATVLWNGPMGVFEFPNFAEGTKRIALAIAETSAITVVGGGDSVAAANVFEVTDRMSHVSTGGGASLEFLEGQALPGILALQD